MPSSPEYQILIRKRWKRKGLCSMCGVEKKRLGFLTGLECQKRYKNYLRKLKQRVLDGYGQMCVCCGTTIFEFLSIDHKYNDGAQERRKLKTKMSAGSLYRMIINQKFPARYQVLCFNCNMALAFFGYCPHHPEIKREVSRRRE